MKKGLIEFGTILISTFLVFGFLLMSDTVKSDVSSELVYRPCNGMDLLESPSLAWAESFDGSGLQYFCHWNDSVIYIQQDLIYAGAFGKPKVARRIMSDAFIEGLTFQERQGKKIRDSKIAFDYYYPVCDGSDGCPTGACPVSETITSEYEIHPETNNKQWVLIGDWTANFSSSTESFSAAIDDFTTDAMACGCDQWCHYEQEIGEVFDNDWGSSFDNRNRDLGTVGFEVGNVYIANLRIIGTEETVDVW